MSPPPLPSFISRQVHDGRYWFLRLRSGPSDETTAVCGGYEAVTPDYDLSRPGFTFQTVELVVGGSGTIELGGRVYPLAAGTGCGYGPAIPHRIRTDPERPLRKYFLCFSGLAAETLLAASPVGREPVWVTDITQMADLFDLLHENGSTGRDHRLAAPITSRLVEIILMKFAQDGHPVGIQPSRGAVETFRAIRRYLRSEFLSAGSVEEVARRFDITSAYLARLFRRFERTTPHSFLTRLRMAHAASLLLGGSCQVKDVADRLGYSDPFHFSRAFKAEFGVSPREFMSRTGRRGLAP